MEQSKRKTAIIFGLALLLIITVIISFRLGRYPISTSELFAIIFSPFSLDEPFWTDQTESILLNVRLPRILLGCLVIPHLTRRLVGNNYKYLMPATMLSGAIFLLLVDNVSRNLLATEIPLGILTAFVGAPCFIYLITRKGEVY